MLCWSGLYLSPDEAGPAPHWGAQVLAMPESEQVPDPSRIQGYRDLLSPSRSFLSAVAVPGSDRLDPRAPMPTCLSQQGRKVESQLHQALALRVCVRARVCLWKKYWASCSQAEESQSEPCETDTPGLGKRQFSVRQQMGCKEGRHAVSQPHLSSSNRKSSLSTPSSVWSPCPTPLTLSGHSLPGA